MSTTTAAADGSVEQLLRAWQGGSDAARDRLFALLHRELRMLAQRRLAAEAVGHTLAPTALVHEVYLRLCGPAPHCSGRADFFALAATVMRRALVDSARRRRARRQAQTAARQLEPVATAGAACDDRVLRLDQALERLQRCDAELFRIVELRFLAGLDVAAAAAALGVSSATVKRGWRTARAFLQREIERDD